MPSSVKTDSNWKIFWTNIFFWTQKFFFQSKFFFTQKHFSARNIYLTQKYFRLNNFFQPQIFFPQLFQFESVLTELGTTQSQLVSHFYQPLLNRYWNKKWNYSFCLKTYDKKPSITKYFPFLLTIPKLFVTGNGIIQTGNRNNSAFSCPWIIKLFLQNMSNF